MSCAVGGCSHYEILESLEYSSDEEEEETREMQGSQPPVEREEMEEDDSDEEDEMLTDSTEVDSEAGEARVPPARAQHERDDVEDSDEESSTEDTVTTDYEDEVGKNNKQQTTSKYVQTMFLNDESEDKNRMSLTVRLSDAGGNGRERPVETFILIICIFDSFGLYENKQRE